MNIFWAPIHLFYQLLEPSKACNNVKGPHMALGIENAYLPEYKMFSDDSFNCIVTPNIPVQTLASKILNILNVDH